ncbi:hypothetical protein PR048_015086 [Dryococelus australis]|uniref:Integrase catalytic domain-containing protein n=1 Tax=Dryococelus australis TaxID=614101 RepID=A0ABQ9HFZ0_9NEOP|nr:hypothetical protein PR048_015086 [Dryococelus australis]
MIAAAARQRSVLNENWRAIGRWLRICYKWRADTIIPSSVHAADAGCIDVCVCLKNALVIDLVLSARPRGRGTFQMVRANGELSLPGKVAENYRRWRRQCELYTARPIRSACKHTISAAKKVALLLIAIRKKPSKFKTLDEGLKPDPDKLRAVVDMKVPANERELHILLGMITYVSEAQVALLSLHLAESRLKHAHDLTQVFMSEPGKRNLFVATTRDLPKVRENFDVDFIIVQLLADKLPDLDVAEHAGHMVEFEEKYFFIMEIVDALADEYKCQVQGTVRTKTHSSRIALPNITLPNFDGDPRQWPNFSDLFATLVLHNSDVPPIAWKLLVDRYKNKRLLTNAHVEAVLQAPSASFKGPSLHRLLSVITGNVSALKALDVPVDKWDLVLLLLICKCLGAQLQTQWELTLGRELPTLTEFISFLDKHCHGQETVNAAATKTFGAHSAMPKPTPAVPLWRQPRNQSSNQSSKCWSTTLSAVTPLLSTPSSVVLLSTVQVHILDAAGTTFVARALLDTANQASFIYEHCSQRLGLARKKMHLPIQGLSNAAVNVAKSFVSIVVTPCGSPDMQFSLDVFVLPHITSMLPSVQSSSEVCCSVAHLKLSDPDFDVPRPVDLLIGADIVPRFLTEGKINGSPMALDSIFGDTFLGKVEAGPPAVPSTSFYISLLTLSPLEDVVRWFLETEEFPPVKHKSVEEIRCEDLFVDTHRRYNTGWYVVCLPFHSSMPELGASRQAVNRLLRLERHFKGDPLLKQLYSDFRDSTLQIGIWTRDLMEEYRLKIVMYGVSSAPYLALRIFQQLAEDEKERFLLASNVLKSDVYVDDVVTALILSHHTFSRWQVKSCSSEGSVHPIVGALWGFIVSSPITSRGRVVHPCHHLVIYQCLDILADCSFLGEFVPSPTENFCRQQVGVIQKRYCFCAEGSSLSPSIRKLVPFEDETGLLRVGSKLQHSDIPFDHKHPVLLPKTHMLTDLVIGHYHERNQHPGIRTLQGILREIFWILSDNYAITLRLHYCVRCWRAKPPSCTSLMDNLPTMRVQQVKSFAKVGVDYAGPILISASKTRKSSVLKVYLCIFVCCATKTVHVEVSSDLSTDVFLAAYKRFVSRRGRSSEIYSDCGTNFVEAVLNSRPLCPVSSDPNDFVALAPGHFLTLEPLVAEPEPNHESVSLNRLQHWQLIETTEYLLCSGVLHVSKSFVQDEMVLLESLQCALLMNYSGVQLLNCALYLNSAKFIEILDISRWARVTTETLHVMHVGAMRRWSGVLLSSVLVCLETRASTLKEGRTIESVCRPVVIHLQCSSTRSLSFCVCRHASP